MMTRGSFASLIATVALVSFACGRGKDALDGETQSTAAAEQSASAASGAGDSSAPDTTAMRQLVLAKINADPAIEGKATLVEFRQKSISSQALGDRMTSAVVEFEGIVTFSSDVRWSWQGPTKAGEPARFEARAEYLNQGKGWKLVEPIGIYPL